MRLLIAVCIALGAQAQTKPERSWSFQSLKPDCTDPFSFEQKTFIELDQHSPPSVAPGVLKGVYAYVGDLMKPSANDSTFDLLVFDTTHAQKWSVPKTMSEPAFIKEARKFGLEPWRASVKEPNDKVGFFAYGESFYLEVVRATPGLKPQLRICRRP